MDLWTEFEGHTIDSAFALNKLLQTEGRSAFFSTLNSKGESVLIRIVECHFDEDEILARWRGVQALNHPNFLRIDHYGQFLIEADDIIAVYVVFEHVDANLGQVLERGRLSPAEAAQIGLTMASALETLHASGFVHEHLEPANIFAVGETVKLRSDCVRETPEGDRGIECRRRDVHDLAVVIELVLRGMVRGYSAGGHVPLPSPFEDIVRNGMSGLWGLSDMSVALASVKGSRPAVTPKPTILSASRPEPARPVVSSPVPTPNVTSSAAHAPSADAASPAATVLPRDAAKPFSSRAGHEDARFGRPAPAEKTAVGESRLRWRASFLLEEWLERFQGSAPRWIAAVVMLLLVVLCGWGLVHHFFTGRTGDVAQAAGATHSVVSPPQAAPSRSRTAAARSVASRSKGASIPAAQRSGVQWRVVAFTYNRQDQATKKAASLAQKLPGLQPEAFSPNGKSPWLVTIGGPLQRDDAYALARKARSLGLPHDTYAQNYTVR